MAIVNLPVVGRLTLEVGGERVTVAPFVMSEFEAVTAANGIEVLYLFADHIEEPSDFTARGMVWVGAACRAWQAAVEAMIAKLAVPTNRAARRRQN